ncbi:hypothetical protein BDZ94DRAFT_1258256, partial [Collybia nuda]
MFPMDIMHLVSLNDPDLLLGLWRGTVKVYAPDTRDNWDWLVLVGKVWDAHGRTVELLTPYIPSSFGRAPRNPATKGNTGYKAWEYQLYFYGLGPALLRHILPEKFWINYCQMTAGVRLLQQWSIPTTDIVVSTHHIHKFVGGFEEMYYQRREDRIHFIRQSIHLLPHIPAETVHRGPLACYAQWTLETAIGNLGEEIRQDRDPYSNIAQRGILRAQLNSITAMLPDILLSDESLPRGAKDLGDKYVLLRACEDTPKPVTTAEAVAIMDYWETQGWPNQDQWPRAVARWARLRLPNGQTARSTWYEERATKPLRKTSCVKFGLNQQRTLLADIKYFFRIRFGNISHTLAVISVFSSRDEELFQKSHGTVYVCRHQGDAALKVINVKSIESVVSMCPDYQVTSEGVIIRPENQFFFMEAPFLKVTSLWGQANDEDDNEGDFRLDDTGV